MAFLLEGGSGTAATEGANFVFCDGSLSFISDLIEHDYNGCNASYYNISSIVGGKRRIEQMGVYQYLGIRDDAQPISKDY